MLSKELVNVIENCNPFEGRLVVRSNDIWGVGFPDVPSLNAHVSNEVYDAVDKVRSGKRKVIGFTITAEKGVGKSHLISRIRNKVQADKSALFMYMSQVGDLDKIKAEFLQNLAYSLKKIGSEGVSQWQELATALVNEAYNHEQSYTPEKMVQQFSQLQTKNPNVVNSFCEKIIDIKSEIIENPDIITAILWTLSSSSRDRLDAINWLAGKELAQFRADAMGLPNPSQEDKEADAFNTACQILDLISDYKPIVICFDELDIGDYDRNESGYLKSHVIASLGKELYDRIKRGILLTAMYPETWRDQIKVLSYADAVTDRIGEKKRDLNHLNSEDVITLVSQWLQDFYQGKKLIEQLPYPLFPFEQEELRELGKERPTFRKVLQWCEKRWKVPDESTAITLQQKEQKHPVESAYNKELAALDSSSLEEYMQNNALLVKSLRFNFSTLEGKSLEGLKIKHIVEIKDKADRKYINFKIIGEQDGKVFKTGIAVLETGVSTVHGLMRLVNYRKFDLTRGCLVRSKKPSPGTKADEELKKLLSPSLDGKWVQLKDKEIKPLLAIYFVMNSREDYELSENQIKDFVSKKNIATGNSLIRKIIIGASGKFSSN